jgi:signal peptidase II
MKKILPPLIIVIGIVLDQGLKSWVSRNIPLGAVRSFIPGLLSLRHETNNGAAWSSFSGQQWFFLLLTPIVVIAALYFLWKKNAQNGYVLGLSLIISGALGNFIDRLHQGFVVDMFQTDFINFPIFNIADSLLTVGFVVLFIAILMDKEEKQN